MTPITALGSRYGIQGALGRSVKRASTASTWWDLNGTITSCIAAYQGKGAASYAASLVNLANSGSYNLTEVASSPTWDVSYGWQGGTTNYLSTGIPDSFCGTGRTVAARWSDRVSGGNQFIAGHFGYVASGNRYFGIQWHYANFRLVYLDTSNFTYNTAHSVTVMAGLDGYADGVYKGTVGGTPTYFPSGNLPIIKGDAKVQAVAFYDEVLTSTQIANLSTAMAAL